MNIPIFRVQDKDGRGPYRPGYSHTWIDADHDRNPTFFDEFDWRPETTPDHWHRNENGGCGFRTLAGLYRWFSSTERAKLQRAGFSIVTMRVDRIIAESDNQLVFGRTRALRHGCTILPWQDNSADSPPLHLGEMAGESERR